MIILHLSLIENIGPAAIQHLVQKIGVDRLNYCYRYTESDFRVLGFSEKQAALLVAGLANRRMLDEEIMLLEKEKIQLITFLDAEYPPLLNTIYLPPPVLYVQGTLPRAEQRTVAVVGSRDCDDYAQTIIDLLIPDLVTAHFGIVSGGARGVDTMAHTATINAGGLTYAVLGSGLLQPYPARNKKLFSTIVETGGGVISSFPLRMEALPGNFPARNRIVTGLSHGCLVVQATAVSGAKISARYALEQSRELFVVPGLITNPRSAGCHQLLQQGAHLVTSSTDILSVFGCAPTIDTMVDEKATDKKQQTTIQTYTQPAVKKSVPAVLVIDVADKTISLVDRVLYMCTRPTFIDDLVEQTGSSLLDVQELLFELQLSGTITQQSTGAWVREL